MAVSQLGEKTSETDSFVCKGKLRRALHLLVCVNAFKIQILKKRKQPILKLPSRHERGYILIES